jgi:hypothetical protein
MIFLIITFLGINGFTRKNWLSLIFQASDAEELLSSAIPILRGMDLMLQSIDGVQSTGLKAVLERFRKEVRQALNDRLASPTCLAATFLDPRYAFNEHVLPEVHLQEAADEIIQLCMLLLSIKGKSLNLK